MCPLKLKLLIRPYIHRQQTLSDLATLILRDVVWGKSGKVCHMESVYVTDWSFN